MATTWSIMGKRAEDYFLDEIEQVGIRETRVIEAWTSDVQMEINFTEGRKIKLFAGQTFGIRKELKYFIHEKLIEFLNLDENGEHKRPKKGGKRRISKSRERIERFPEESKNLEDEFERFTGDDVINFRREPKLSISTNSERPKTNSIEKLKISKNPKEFLDLDREIELKSSEVDEKEQN